jgi:hypothetical protein
MGRSRSWLGGRLVRRLRRPLRGRLVGRPRSRLRGRLRCRLVGRLRCRLRGRLVLGRLRSRSLGGNSSW